MKKIKVGLPRAGFYYKDGIFWKNYLTMLGCKVIITDSTNSEKISNGINNIKQNNCLANKIYLGHILKLYPICEYILVHTDCEYMLECPNYKLLLSNIKTLIPSTQLIYYNNKYSFISKIKIAIKFTKNPIRIIYSYIKAYIKQINYNINKQNNNKNKINNKENIVLLAGQISMIEDNYIMHNIIKILPDYNITPILSNGLSMKQSLLFYQYFGDNKIKKSLKQIIGSIYYYKYAVKKIIYINNNNCIIENYIIDKISTDIKNIPIEKIEITENTNDIILINTIEIILNLIKK